MNTYIQKSGYKPLYICLLAGLLMTMATTAQAGTVCADYDGDPQTEGNGTSSATGEHAASCGRFNTAAGDFAAAFGNANDATSMASCAGQNNRNRVCTGFGYQKSQAALSIGYQRLIDEKSTFSISGALGRKGTNTVGVGYGFGW